MKLVMLLERRLKPVPENIQILQDWGHVDVHFDMKEQEEECKELLKGMTFEGDHVYLEGTEEAFKNWLRPFKSVWIADGCSPMEQRFQVVHVKED